MTFANNNQPKFDIVMFNMSTMYDWDHGVVNRNFNILNTLAKEDLVSRIVAVDFFPLKCKRAASHYLKNILWEVKGAEMVYGDLTSACYQKTDKIYVYSSIDSIFSWKIVARELRKIEKALNLKNIIFWSYNPLFLDFIGKLNEKLFVFDTVDNWSEHSEYLKLASKNKLLENYKIIADQADVIFTVSEELLDFYKKLSRQRDIHWVPNGVDYDHLNDPELLNKDNELAKLSGKIIGYLGTINKDRLDLDLIADLAQHNLDKNIVLGGPVWQDSKKEINQLLKKYKNIHLLGRIDWADAPSFISRFDVAIIPHKINEFIKSTNPMKMYDYLACGKPIVSTPGAGLDLFAEFIDIASTSYEFNKAVNQVLINDTAHKQDLRRQAVKEHSWHKRVDEMVEIIAKKLLI